VSSEALVAGLTLLSFGIIIAAVAFGSAIGDGIVASKAVEAIARQPEALGDIRANMILTAALVEGAAFFAMVVGLLVVFKS